MIIRFLREGGEEAERLDFYNPQELNFFLSDTCIIFFFFEYFVELKYFARGAALSPHGINAVYKTSAFKPWSFLFLDSLGLLVLLFFQNSSFRLAETGRKKKTKAYSKDHNINN